jgi:hypothetical protein
MPGRVPVRQGHHFGVSLNPRPLRAIGALTQASYPKLGVAIERLVPASATLLLPMWARLQKPPRCEQDCAKSISCSSTLFPCYLSCYFPVTIPGWKPCTPTFTTGKTRSVPISGPKFPVLFPVTGNFGQRRVRRRLDPPPDFFLFQFTLFAENLVAEFQRIRL